MADSGSGSGKGFPEAGGKHCKPQGQEDALSLKGHRGCCLPSERTTRSVKTWVRFQGPKDTADHISQSPPLWGPGHGNTSPEAQRAVPPSGGLHSQEVVGRLTFVTA